MQFEDLVNDLKKGIGLVRVKAIRRGTASPAPSSPNAKAALFLSAMLGSLSASIRAGMALFSPSLPSSVAATCSATPKSGCEKARSRHWA
jgi:hypothetical protein